ncbi:AEC family transporter [Homoserinibacter sp. YIM 151385]|uniref:AEC family transporter n=1 Tax=Homoserinibacter sp. YIM 151385 TaxID=2985506 RepID=UPI0022F0A824|nr:AEC family transporter [Homoserinibacter sp. YIM 151385]WBU39399.1 AEC family transporter [Homoserinibacter sp. YIM 151385]
MIGVLTGFAIIAVVIGAGYLIARIRIVPEDAGIALNRTAFFVASPALLFTILAEADLREVFSGFLLVAALTAVAAAILYVALSRILFRMPMPETVVGATASGYVNANNIGLPVAVYVVGDVQYVVPVMLFQLIVVAPVVLGLLDVSALGNASPGKILTQPLRNPIIVGSALGVLVAILGLEVPEPIMAPLEILGGAAVPLMLLAFGMSLRGQRPLAPGSRRRAIVAATVIKSVVAPAVAYLLAQFAFHLPAEQVVAATIMAALPAAQNVNNYAVRYGRGVILARDAVLLSTAAAVPVIFILAALFHLGA